MKVRRTIIQTFRALPAFYREVFLDVNRKYCKKNGYSIVLPQSRKID